VNQPARVPARPRRGVVGSILATLGLVLAKAKGAAFLLLGKLKLVLVLGLKLVKLGTFGWTMLLAAWLYAGMYGWRFGVGLVLLTLIHECGHVAAARWLGLPVSAPVFIPFFGAYVKLRHLPRSSWENFLVSVGGPLLGAVASGLCVLASTGAGERLAGLLPLGLGSQPEEVFVLPIDLGVGGDEERNDQDLIDATALQPVHRLLERAHLLRVHAHPEGDFRRGIEVRLLDRLPDGRVPFAITAVRDDEHSPAFGAARGRCCDAQEAQREGEQAESEHYRERTSVRNSPRVFSFVRNTPSIELVTVRAFCFWTPRIMRHRCCASMTTATPRGWTYSLSASAICVVSRSCTWSRRA